LHSEECSPQGAGRIITGQGEPRAVYSQHYGGQRPVLPIGRTFEEAATPGQPAVIRRCFSGRSLPTIHPREPSGTAGSAAMPGRTLKNISLCLHALCLITLFIATEKPRAFVQKLWMTGTSCGNARKNWKKPIAFSDARKLIHAVHLSCAWIRVSFELPEISRTIRVCSNGTRYEASISSCDTLARNHPDRGSMYRVSPEHVQSSVHGPSA
jgi:hypothetical protein